MPTVQRKPPSQYTKQTDPFYLSKEWRSARHAHLVENPLCFYCQLTHIITVATLVDHFKPKRLFPELALVREFFRSSCDHHHNLKRVFERKIATREQFEREIGTFIKSITNER